MKKIINSSLCMVLLGLLVVPAAFGASLDDLRGGWSFLRTNENNQVFTQTLEIEKEKFIFKIIDAGKKTILFAKGEVKVETHSSLNLISFTHIESGDSPSDLSPMDDDYHFVYSLDDDKLSFAADFDKNRGKTPHIEVYTKVKK